MKTLMLLTLLTSCNLKIMDTKNYIVLSEGVEIRCNFHEENNEYSDCVSSRGLKLEKVKVISGFVATIPNGK